METRTEPLWQLYRPAEGGTQKRAHIWRAGKHVSLCGRWSREHALVRWRGELLDDDVCQGCFRALCKMAGREPR